MLLNQIIENYKIVNLLGKGGMASVYLAENFQKNPQKVAIKVLELDIEENAEYTLRFKKEAFICSKFSHPNIVKVYSYGIFEDKYYLIMEFVDGKDLSFYIRNNKKRSIKDIINIAYQISSALSFAHKNKVIHRDIKPQNIILDKYGKIKITDFGIAKINVSHTLTAEGERVVGTTYYMSPEQIKGEPIDLKTDIYSMGILLYEMVSGKNPYEANTPLAIINGHLYKTPAPLKNIRNDVPDYFINVINKCIAKNKNDRFNSADEIIQALKSKKIEQVKAKSKLSLFWEETQKVIEIKNKETFIGRDKLNNIILKDSYVSRRHSKITILDGNYIIEDLGSTNGTYVNGEKIIIHYLTNGDKIKIGNNFFIFNC
ncbi:MAG: FHA domain-containing serine/threonine-protein kinase [Deltaproteobacteria bacterium]|nr:FHA domain-containing serine/threonine-protein kinase [Deltaproteobacteria bacterium]